MTDFTELVDLAAERVGGAVVLDNDEFFAAGDNLLRAAPPIWDEHRYTERGKWMDGWETRRRRDAGHDWCVVRLGLPGEIRGVLVDTSYFRGNYPDRCSLDACALPGVPSAEEVLAADWREILPCTPLEGDARNSFPVEAAGRFTHVRLNIYPDGGVARLRVFGEVVPDWERLLRRGGQIDLACVEHGGRVLSASDMFFGHRHNLILPGRSTHMGDGWETKRRRGGGHDWTIVRLGAPGVLRRVEIDTDHFKGNAPESCTLEVCDAPGAELEELDSGAVGWHELLPRTRLQPHARHVFEAELLEAGRATHARLGIFPDGGVARLRLFAPAETIGPTPASPAALAPRPPLP